MKVYKIKTTVASFEGQRLVDVYVVCDSYSEAESIFRKKYEDKDPLSIERISGEILFKNGHV